MRFLADAVTIGTTTLTDKVIDGSVEVDKKDTDELMSGVDKIATEAVAVSVKGIDITAAEYNALRAYINQNVTIVFKRDGSSLFSAVNCRVYPKMGLGKNGFTLDLTGGKKFNVSDTFGNHVVLPS